MFSLQQNQRTREWNRFCSEVGMQGRGKKGGSLRGWEEVAKSMYTHLSKYKNDK
jgi:hypothetical protein